MITKKTSSRIYYGILAFAAVLYAVMAASDMVWADEAYTFGMLRRSFSEIWKITAADVHPPLYYFAVKLFSLPFGGSQYAVRLFSGVCYWILLAVGGSQIRKLFSDRVGLLFMGLFLLYPFSMEAAAEARMYAMASLEIFLLALFAWRIWQSITGWDWVGFTISGVCAAYTHYFALVSAGIIYGLLFFACLVKNRKLLKPWLAASLVTAALYLPWLQSFVQQLAFKVNNDYWITPIGVKDLYLYALSLLHANGHSAFPLFFGLLLIGLLIRSAAKKDAAALLALAVPVLTMAVGLGVSLLIRPVFIIRYLLPCGPLLILFLAGALSGLRWDSLRIGAAAVLLVSFAGNLMFALTDLRPQPEKIGAALMQQTAQAEAYVVVSADNLHISQVVSFYETERPIYSIETLGAASPYQNVFDITEFSGVGKNAFVMITDVGKTPDAAYAGGFNTELLGTYYDVFEYVDFWLLTRN